MMVIKVEKESLALKVIFTWEVMQVFLMEMMNSCSVYALQIPHSQPVTLSSIWVCWCLLFTMVYYSGGI